MEETNPFENITKQMDPSADIVAGKLRSVSKGRGRACPICGSTAFQILGYAPKRIYKTPYESEARATAIPAVIVGCSTCGYLTEHAIAALGIPF